MTFMQKNHSFILLTRVSAVKNELTDDVVCKVNNKNRVMLTTKLQDKHAVSSKVAIFDFSKRLITLNS